MKQKTVTHKITKDLQDKIYLVASTLPPMGKTNPDGSPVYKSVQVSGTQVKKEDLKPGTPLIPNAMYKINQLQYVNHALEMIRLVQRDGASAIEAYESDIRALQTMAIRDMKKINSPINKLKSWIKRKIAR